MREILFRGKRTHDDEWIAGSLHIEKFTDDNEYLCCEICQCGVYPETVGQYIGFRDKKDKRIFEGDILAWNNGEMDEDGNPFEDEISLIVFSERFHAFVQRWQNGVECVLEAFSGEEQTVIGNIYDNPELFESEIEQK